MDFDEAYDYLDSDDILAQTQVVNCKFLLNIPGLEFLSPAKSQDATQGAEMSLPFWLAKTLYTYSMIDIDVPRSYSQNTRDILAAGPEMVDLHRMGPHYYKFGKHLIDLRREKGNNLEAYNEEGQRNKYRREEGEMLEERQSIAVSLVSAFHSRRHKIMDYSTNPRTPAEYRDVHAFESRLDNMEKRLFQMGRQQVHEINIWKTRKMEVITNNQIAAKLSKRRKIKNET